MAGSKPAGSLILITMFPVNCKVPEYWFPGFLQTVKQSSRTHYIVKCSKIRLSGEVDIIGQIVRK